MVEAEGPIVCLCGRSSLRGNIPCSGNCCEDGLYAGNNKRLHQVHLTCVATTATHCKNDKILIQSVIEEETEYIDNLTLNVTFDTPQTC